MLGEGEFFKWGEKQPDAPPKLSRLPPAGQVVAHGLVPFWAIACDLLIALVRKSMANKSWNTQEFSGKPLVALFFGG